MSPSPNAPRSFDPHSDAGGGKPRYLGLVMVLLAVVSSLFAFTASSATAAGENIRICHAGNSDTNPYQNNPPDDGSKVVSGHDSHNGPVWRLGLKDAHIDWGDIIPPFNYTDKDGNALSYAGKNWTAEGQLIWGNGCAPVPAAAVTPTVSTSVCAGGVATLPSYTVPTTTGVIYKVGAATVTGVRTGVSTTETLTAVAAPGYTLTNAPFSVVMTFGPLAVGCGAPTPATAVGPDPTTASSCVAGVVTPSSYVVPTTTGVIYAVTGVGTVVSGSTRYGSAPDTETLTATAAPGFVLNNPAFSATVVFLPLAPGCTSATAVNAAAVTPSSCVNNAAVPSSWVVPTTTGVQYKVNGTNVVSGSTRSGSAPTQEVLTAVALQNYTLANPAFSQTISFGALATNCAPVVIPVTPTSPDLSIVKAGPTSAVKPGDNVPYTLTVTNVGTGSASNVQVTDALPAAMSFVSASGSGFTCSGTSSISCQLAGSLAPGASAVVNVVATLSSTYGSTAIANTAVVLPTDSNPANNTDTESTAVTLPTPPVDEDLGLSKTGLEPSVSPGGVLSWTLNVTNVKGTPAAGFTVTDVVPAGLTVLSAGGTDYSCSVTGQTVSCTYTGAPLPVGGSAAFQIDAVVAADYAPTEVSNTAIVDPGGVDATNDSATSVTPVTEVITGGGGGGVTEPTPAPEPATGGGGPVLPFTGTNADQLLSWGVTVLMLGLLLAIVGRRRRSA